MYKRELEVFAGSLPVTLFTNNRAIDISTVCAYKVCLAEVFAAKMPAHPSHSGSHTAPRTRTVTPTALLWTSLIISSTLCTLATSHLDEACRSRDTCVIVVSDCVWTFHATFTIDNSNSLLRADLSHGCVT